MTRSLLCQQYPLRVDDVVIVGAGPAGLAAAATLRSHGIDATIIERGRVGEPWRKRYDRLHLHTIRSLSHLPGYRIPRDFGRWVARDQFVQYLEQYAAHHCLEPRFGVEVTRIDRDNGHWSVRTTAGTIPSRDRGGHRIHAPSTIAAMAWHIR